MIFDFEVLNSNFKTSLYGPGPLNITFGCDIPIGAKRAEKVGVQNENSRLI